MLTDASVVSKGIRCSQTGAFNSILATGCVTYISTHTCTMCICNFVSFHQKQFVNVTHCVFAIAEHLTVKACIAYSWLK